MLVLFSFGRQIVCKHCGQFLNQKCFSQSSQCKQHERTHTGEKPYTCTYCQKCFGCSSHLKNHERTHTGEKPYTCKHCKRFFSQSSQCKRHEVRHARAGSLKQNQGDQCFKLKGEPREPDAALGGKKSCMLASLTEENSSQVESLTCWICLKEFSSEACVIEHYDEHMRLK